MFRMSLEFTEAKETTKNNFITFFQTSHIFTFILITKVVYKEGLAITFILYTLITQYYLKCLSSE
jgi:hypothetical protein